MSEEIEYPEDYMQPPRDARVIYIQKETNGSAKILAWVAGLAGILVSASICFAASALWNLNGRLASLETKVEMIQSTIARRP